MGRDIECSPHQMENNTIKKKAGNSSSSSVSISKSSSAALSSPSPFTAISSPIDIAPAAPVSPKYSMEEVWKDICLSTLHHSTSKTTATPSSTTGGLQGIVFQEFLSRPPKSSRVPSHSTNHHHDCLPHSSFGGTESSFSESQGQPTKPIPPSSFSLPDIHQDNHVHRLVDSSTIEFSVLPKKRVTENEDSCHRNKRMIKNRESAARSRARKQAYTNELEMKVARLMEENAKLRRQQEKLCLDATAQLPKKHILYRTLTAPF